MQCIILETASQYQFVAIYLSLIGIVNLLAALQAIAGRYVLYAKFLY